jgi:hypothetical protein
MAGAHYVYSMLEKQEFYWGAAIVHLLEDPRCVGVAKRENGYVVNATRFIVLKYSTKSRTPWRFSFGADEIKRLVEASSRYESLVIGLVCGGDGVCAITWKQAAEILGKEPGWISVRRNFHERYAVTGSAGELPGKVPLRDWPALLFES